MQFTLIFAAIESSPVILAIISAAGIMAVPRYAIWAARAVAVFFGMVRREREKK